MTDTPPKPPNPRLILEQAGLDPKKSWGQCFLADQNVLAAIAAAAGGSKGDTVVELGAGLGALTYHLLLRGLHVVAVERDREMVPLLREALEWAGSRLEILEADAARIDYQALAARLGGLSVAGNLPYQIASRILVAMADTHDAIDRGVVLVQREVAERLRASPGSKTYGLLSVLVQRAFVVKVLRNVRPGAFFPRPKVDSTVVQLETARGVEVSRDAQLVAAARAAFSSRRKTLRNAIAGALGAEPSGVETAIVEAGIDPGARAETLSVEAFDKLGAALAAHRLL